MGVKVATGCFNWSQSSVSHSSSSSSSPQTLASAISSPSCKRRTLIDSTLVCRSSVFGKKLNRSQSCEILKLSTRQRPIRRIVSANLDPEFSDDELSLRFQLSDDEETDSLENHAVPESEPQNPDKFVSLPVDWPRDMIPASIERKANSVELPFSLRIIQRKKQWEEGFRETGESAYCSMKKAFSSMVFIIRELQSYTLQLREVLFFEDLQGILVRVQKEMNASFVWLFQQVFSHTPTLMLYVMILLANYSVHSMSNNVATASPPPPSTVESVSTIEDQTTTKFDSVNPGEKTTSIGGINDGGGKSRPVTSGTDGDGKFDESIEHQSFITDGPTSSTENPTRTGEESVSGQKTEIEEWQLWKSMVAEADKMQEVIGNGGLDHETMQKFVSPVTVKINEEVDTEDYSKTELFYQTGLSKEPNNPLLLANYAQFLYLFAHDHDRAEVYFKRASEMEPKDAETLGKYASFLWRAKKDLWAAEETYLEAISVDPDNSFYTATYAFFLWTNGADDTCFPLDSPENVNYDEF
ncbi:hypothetical protein L1887_05489 [Cichorium endivia]|nr:hypothetical protein L1887_05489 [Cichorium endivia]